MSNIINRNSWNWFTPRSTQDTELLEQWGLIPGLKDFLVLRQIHALEHATVWILGEMSSNEKVDRSLDREDLNIGGMSTEKGFFLYGDINPLKLKKAVNLALNRLKTGEWDLALHPRCGTNTTIAAILTTGAILTTHFILPREALGKLLGIGLATATATYLAPEIGMSVQRYITTAIPFNLKIEKITRTLDKFGHPAYFVGLKWHNLQ